MRLHTSLIAAAAVLLATTSAAAQEIQAKHITVELISEHTTLKPGAPFRVGLRIDLEKDWHTYWRNPGDAGLATSFELALPDGFTASEIEWPFPERFGDAPEVSYGYHGTLVLPVTITPPPTMKPGDVVRLGARTSWLVCNEQCIPGKAELALSLPVSGEDQSLSQWSALFDEADRAVARRPGKISITARRVDGHYEIRVANAGERRAPLPTDVWFYAYNEGIVDHSATQDIEHTDGELTLRVPISPYEEEKPTQLRGILVAPGSWNGSDLRAIIVDTSIDSHQSSK